MDNLLPNMELILEAQFQFKVNQEQLLFKKKLRIVLVMPLLLVVAQVVAQLVRLVFAVAAWLLLLVMEKVVKGVVEEVEDVEEDKYVNN